MISKILFVIWYFLPASFANASPVIASRLPMVKNWNYPLDFYKKYKGQRLLGDHKTIRGLIIGIIIGGLTGYFQQIVLENNNWVFLDNAPIDYYHVSLIKLGSIMGFGSVLGDTVKSFFKRRINIKPGGMWFPFDQIDYILGSSLLSVLYLSLEWQFYIIYLIFGMILHLLTNALAYLLKIKDVPY